MWSTWEWFCLEPSETKSWRMLQIYSALRCQEMHRQSPSILSSTVFSGLLDYPCHLKHRVDWMHKQLLGCRDFMAKDFTAFSAADSGTDVKAKHSSVVVELILVKWKVAVVLNFSPSLGARVLNSFRAEWKESLLPETFWSSCKRERSRRGRSAGAFEAPASTLFERDRAHVHGLRWNWTKKAVCERIDRRAPADHHSPLKGPWRIMCSHPLTGYRAVCLT